MGRALLIDDDAGLLESYSAAARASGYELDTASTWEAGLNAFHTGTHDSVVADYNMPGSRMGLHLLVEIRRLNPGIRLVLLSGYVDEHEAAEILRLGIADRVLTKSLPGTYEAVMDELARAQAVDRHAPTDWRDLAAAHVRFASLTEEELGALDAAITRKLGGE